LAIVFILVLLKIITLHRQQGEEKCEATGVA